MVKIIPSIVCVIIASASLIKGAALIWAALLWSTLIFTLLSVVLRSHRAIKPLTHPAIIIFLVFQCWGLIQLLSPISNDTTSGYNNLLIGLAFVSCIQLVFMCFRSNQTLKLLLYAILTMGSLQAFYGLFVVLTQTNLILWMPKTHYLNNATGTFVNPNHFCAYLNLCGLLFLAYIAASYRLVARNQTHLMLQLLSAIYSYRSLVFLLFLAAIIASRSVAGIASFTVGLFSLLAITALKQSKSQTLILMGILPTLVFMLLFLGQSSLPKEVAHLPEAIERRLELSAASMSMLKEYGLFGAGNGSFYASFPEFRDINVGSRFYANAHNDWLQFWIEFGAIGLILLACFIISCIKQNLNEIKAPTSHIRLAFAYASFASTAALCLHSVVDFPLQLPGYAILYLTIITLNLSRSSGLKTPHPLSSKV